MVGILKILFPLGACMGAAVSSWIAFNFLPHDLSARRWLVLLGYAVVILIVVAAQLDAFGPHIERMLRSLFR